MKFRTVAQGAFSGITEKRQVTINTPEEWNRFWEEHSSGSSKVKQPAVDFKVEAVIAITMGRQRTGGFSVKVVDVQRVGKNTHVAYEEKQPPRGGMSLQALTSPFHIVTVPKPLGKVVFKSSPAKSP